MEGTSPGVCYLQCRSQGCAVDVLFEGIGFPATQRPNLAVRQPLLCCCSSFAETVALEGCRVKVTDFLSPPQILVEVISQDGMAVTYWNSGPGLSARTCK